MGSTSLGSILTHAFYDARAETTFNEKTITRDAERVQAELRRPSKQKEDGSPRDYNGGGTRTSTIFSH